MSRVYSDQLFVLIKSLKQAEKRYFHRWVKRNGESETKYFLLFQLIDQQRDFDDEALLKKASAIKKAQLSNLKAHLYKNLLQALRHFELEKTAELQLRENIDYIQLLYDRGLYNQCIPIIQKTSKKIEQSGQLELKLELLKWEKLVMKRTLGDSYQQKLHRIIAEVEDTTEKISLINTITNLSAELNALYLRLGYARNEEQKTAVLALLENSLPAYQEEELSLYEKLSLYRLLINYYSFLEELEASMEYAKKLVYLFEAHDELMRIQLEDYLQALNQLMIAEYKAYDYPAFMRSRDRLHELSIEHAAHKKKHIRLQLEKYIYVHEFNRIFMLGKFDLGVKFLERIGDQLEDFIRRIDEHSRVVLYYKIACLYVGNSQYREALEWLNRVQNETQDDLREDVLAFSRILSLVAHYELGNTEVMEYYIRSTYRFLLSRGDISKFQRYILAFLRKLASGFQQEDLIPEFRRLIKQLKPLRQVKYEQRAFVYFDIISWLESKIQNEKVGEVIKEKAKKRLK